MAMSILNNHTNIVIYYKHCHEYIMMVNRYCRPKDGVIANTE